jgi:hypothetical protein
MSTHPSAESSSGKSTWYSVRGPTCSLRGAGFVLRRKGHKTASNEQDICGSPFPSRPAIRDPKKINHSIPPLRRIKMTHPSWPAPWFGRLYLARDSIARCPHAWSLCMNIIKVSRCVPTSTRSFPRAEVYDDPACAAVHVPSEIILPHSSAQCNKAA